VTRKVLIIVENLPVPFDARVWKEALALRAAGYQVTVLCPKDKGYTRGYENLEGVHIYRHPLAKEGSTFVGYIWEYVSALFWQFLYSWWIYLRRGFGVIQGCNPPDNIFLVAVPFKLFGVHYIFDHHDVNPELYFSKFEKKDLAYHVQVWLERLTFYFSDVVISTNQTYKGIAIGRGHVDSERVFVVRNGPDLATFRAVTPKPELKYGKRYLVGYVGTMNVQEGLDILIEVAEYIRGLGRDDIHFTCVGGGPELGNLRKMVADNNLGEMFNFTGRISDADLLDVLSSADICVNPDRPCEMNDLSTMIKIMEYMALGKPIVQFDLKEGRFSAQDASLYCDARDPISNFSAAILWLLDHPEERQRMGEFGQRRVQKELAWEYSIPHLLAAYEQAFGKSRSKKALQTGPARSS